MRAKPVKTLPEYKAPPPPPPLEDKQLTHEGTLSEVLTAIRQHPPEHQNWILREMMREIAFDRNNSVNATREELIRAETHMKEFIDLQVAGERALADKK